MKSIIIVTATILTLVANAQTAYQGHGAELVLYAENGVDPVFNKLSKPAMAFQCAAATGTRYDRTFNTGPEQPHEGYAIPYGGLKAVVVEAGDWPGRTWPSFGGFRDFEGVGSAFVGSSTTGVSVGIENGEITFPAPSIPVLLEAVRTNPSKLTVRVTGGGDKGSLTFVTEGADICRFAHSCGQPELLRPACGPVVRPVNPSYRMMRSEIESILNRYPDP